MGLNPSAAPEKRKNSPDSKDALARARERYRLLYENLPVLCLTIRTDGTVVDCNQRFISFFQTSRDRVVGKPVSALMKPEEYEPFISFIGRDADAGGALLQNVFEFGMPGAGGRFKLNVQTAAVEHEDEGRVITLAMEDVTRLIELEEERKTARLQLYRSAHLAATATFASGLAHEMNNPLTAILGFSSALLSRISEGDSIDKDELTTYLQGIYDASLRCRDIVEHLHRFSSSSGEVRLGTVPLRESAASALRIVARKAEQRGISIVNDLGGDVMVLADANRLEQVFVNLLTNCVDFCRAGAEVRIEQLPEEKERPQYVRCAVRDNGPGMPAAVLAKAFTPFFTTKEPGQGIGMGLAFCHRILEELNGRIELVSAPGAGTTARLELPSAERKAFV